MIEKSLGDVIREARANTGGLREFAKKLGVSPSYMSDIENDRRVPAEDIIRKMANLLNLDFDNLMAMAGRFGKDADRYMRRHPMVGLIIREIAASNVSDQGLKEMMRKVKSLTK